MGEIVKEDPHGLEELFAEEMATFRDALPGLLETDMGRYALVKGELIIVMDTENDALGTGYRDYGNVPFLVERIQEFKPPLELGGVAIEVTE